MAHGMDEAQTHKRRFIRVHASGDVDGQDKLQIDLTFRRRPLLRR